MNETDFGVPGTSTWLAQITALSGQNSERNSGEGKPKALVFTSLHWRGKSCQQNSPCSAASFRGHEYVTRQQNVSFRKPHLPA